MARDIQKDLEFLRTCLAIRKSSLPVQERIVRWQGLLRSAGEHPRILWTLLGADLEEVGRLDEALEWYAKSRAHESMARIYLKFGQRENALACLKRTEQSHRTGPASLLLEAEIRGEFGEHEEVARLLNLAFCRTPEDERAPTTYQQIREIGERFAVPVPRMMSA